jgi:hypothetical protein
VVGFSTQKTFLRSHEITCTTNIDNFVSTTTLHVPETSLATAVAEETGGGSTAYQTEETLTESNRNSTAV